jgi:hypothetical protein
MRFTTLLKYDNFEANDLETDPSNKNYNHIVYIRCKFNYVVDILSKLDKPIFISVDLKSLCYPRNELKSYLINALIGREDSKPFIITINGNDYIFKKRFYFNIKKLYPYSIQINNLPLDTKFIILVNDYNFINLSCGVSYCLSCKVHYSRNTYDKKYIDHAHHASIFKGKFIKF